MSIALGQNDYDNPEYDIVWDDTGESILHLLEFGAIEPMGVVLSSLNRKTTV